jgi:hypothetical protein
LTELKHRKLLVTPRMAKDWLSTNCENRTLSQDWVDKLARDMANGDFPNIGETIKFDQDGNLIDGQHRLSAVVQSGRQIEFIIIEGIDRQHRYKMDKQRKRTAADELTMRFQMPSAKLVAATARIVLLWQIEEIKSEGYKPTDSEIVEFGVKNREPMINAVRYGVNLRHEIGAIPSAAAAMYFLTHEIDPALAVDFWTGVQKGSGLIDGDPELTLRNAIVRMNQVTQGSKLVKPFLGLLAQAWNAKREGKKIRRLGPKSLTELTDEHFRLV